MPIKTIMNEPSELSQILALLNKLDTDVRATNKRLEAEVEENKKKFEKWNERYFQLVKDQGNTARTFKKSEVRSQKSELPPVYWGIEPASN